MKTENLDRKLASMRAKRNPVTEVEPGFTPLGYLYLSEGSDVFTNVIVPGGINLWPKTFEFAGSRKKVVVSGKFRVNENINCSS